MPSPDHRKQRQYNELEIIDPPNTTVPLAINFGEYTDIDMDTGGNENNAASSVYGMCSDGTMTVVEEELSITDHNFNNNDMDYTTSPRPTIRITATNQSNGGFTPVLNGSPNRQTSRERRNTTTNNNCYSALQTTSKTKESSKNNKNNPSAKDRHERKND
jgi:hypothetical protein